MKTVKFWKMSGSGNDFVVIDNRRGAVSGSASKWASRLCHRNEGVGADGLLLLEASKKEDFRMVYFNADGSRASMCGNGARCMAYFANQHKVVGNCFRFQTDAYPVAAEVSKDIVRIHMADAKAYKPVVKAKVGGKTYSAVFLNTGVPHAIVFVPNAEKVDVVSLGRALRFHKAFGPAGTNVNFVQKIGKDRLRVRTYERGVEGETLACGTGVTASAIAAGLHGLVRGPVACLTSGGAVLQVGFTLHPKDLLRPASNVTLKGRVRKTFEGEVHV